MRSDNMPRPFAPEHSENTETDLQRDIAAMDAFVRAAAITFEEEHAWRRLRKRLTPDRERAAGAIGGAIKDHFSDKPWTEVRLIAADAAINAMGEP